MQKNGGQKRAVSSAQGAASQAAVLTGGAPMRLERRAGERWTTEGAGMATFVSRVGGNKLVRVRLLDAGQRGLGVASDEPIEVGSVFTLFPDDVVASASHGRVVRCAHVEGGYRLGLQRLIRHAA